MARRPAKPTSSSRSRSSGRPTRKPTKKKANNTPIIIGVSVAVVFFFIIIIAAANSGGGSSNSSYETEYLSLSQRKAIYTKYIAKCKTIEQDAKDGLAVLDAETRRRASRMTSKKVGNLKYAEINKIQGRYEKKIRNLPKDYIEKEVVAYGRKNGW